MLSSFSRFSRMVSRLHANPIRLDLANRPILSGMGWAHLAHLMRYASSSSVTQGGYPAGGGGGRGRGARDDSGGRADYFDGSLGGSGGREEGGRRSGGAGRE